MPKHPNFRLQVPDHIVEMLRGLHPILKQSVRHALTTILSDPESGKPLKEELKGLRSLRVRRFRVIYRVRPRKRHIEIVAVGPRKCIYEETYKMITRSEDEKG